MKFFHLALGLFSFSCWSEAQLNNELIREYTIIGHVVRMLSAPLEKSVLFVDSEAFDKPLLIPNRLLLYGPPGNGKTTLAYDIAKMAQCQLVHIHAPSIVTKYAGSGAENIKKEMLRAFDVMVESCRPVIIFIDEIDAIAINGTNESRVEDNKAMQELWLYLDKFKQDFRFFIICATNRYEKLNQAFVSRFPERQRLEINQPNKQRRQEVLVNLFSKYDIEIDKNLIRDLAYYSDGMSVREIEDFVSQVKIGMVLEGTIIDGDIVKKIKSYRRGYKSENDPDAPKRDIYDKIHLVSSLFTMASAGTTVVTFVAGLPYIKSLLGA